MKNSILYLIIIYLSLIGTNSKAQIMVGTPYHFCAINGSCYNQQPSRWVTIVDNDYPPSSTIYETEQFMSVHPEFELISPASLLYNCHGYAYSIAQGGGALQIAWREELCSYNGTNHQSYTLINENNTQNGDIATIIDNNAIPLQSRHSSIVYDNNYYVSKWGNLPLFKHPKNDPWIVNLTGLGSESHYVYYRRVTNALLTGPDIIDGSGTYTFSPDVTPVSCTWSVEPANMFQISSGTGYTANLTYATPFTYLAPKAKITFTFSYSCDNHYSISKEIGLLIPTTTISSIAVSEGFVIDTNAVVTVTGEIRSTPTAKTIVPKGTRLIIDGGTMTGDGFNMWHGIEVWGDASAHQFEVNGNYLQGYLKLKNGAKIENAICAVELWKPDNYNFTGGIVIAENSVFHNNAKAIHALHYTNFDPYSLTQCGNNSSFKNCSFIIDNDYLGAETFYKHIDLACVNGIGFRGCSFYVSPDAHNISPWCKGVAAYDAGFALKAYCEQDNNNPNLYPCPDSCFLRCSFTNFYEAIYSSSDGSTPHSFIAEDALFSDNDIGIYANNTGHASISNCSFAVGHENSCGFGVYVENVTSFSIEENSFAPYTGFSGESYGIVVVDCPAQNDIYLNSFDGLTCGNLASGWNLAKTHEFSPSIQGLTYSCNQDTHNTIDFCVLTNSGTGGINPYQGSSINPAGNTFGGSDFHFYNDGNDSIDYYYNPNSTGQTPSLSLMYNVNRISTNANSRCMSHNGGTQEKSQKGKTELEEDFLIASENFKQLVDLYKKLVESGNTEPELAELRAQIAQHANDRSRAASGIVRLILFDSIANPQELRTWLRNEGDLSSERFVIASFIQEGDFDNAMELAKNLPTKYGLEGDDLNDHMDYIRLLELYRTLHKEGRTKNQLTEDETVMVEEIASNTFGISRSLAKALLENQPIKRRTWFPCPELPRPESKERGSSSAEKHKASNFTIKVTPNPASTQAKVDYWLPKVSFNAKLSLVNVFGEQMIEFLLEGDRGSTVIDFGNLPEGVYLIIISDSNGNTFTEKVVKH